MKVKVLRPIKDAFNGDLQIIREKLPDATIDELCNASFIHYSSTSLDFEAPASYKLLPFDISKILLNTNHCSNVEFSDWETSFAVKHIKKDEDMKKYDDDVIVNGILLFMSIMKSMDATEFVINQ